MRGSVLCGSIGLLLLACDAAGGMRLARDAGGDGALADARDHDRDNIADVHEGRSEQRDTDRDGRPDYDDDDSDGDGISDSAEAGDADPRTPPVDSDNDGAPDFIDLDSDDNGIADRDERIGDADSDGIPNFADLDDDGDGISDAQELNGRIAPPVDSDGDGGPDYQDPDSDNDTIRDGHERDADTDNDGLRDTADPDSDNDGRTDATEAGDADLATPPIDSDGDGIPDFRDVDSDNDGLADRAEVDSGTSPVRADSDGDGVSDLIEVAAGTDPSNMADSPRTRGDFVFTVPYQRPPDPARDTLRFKTSIQFADVYFLFDYSESMDDEIDGLQNAVVSVMTNLTCTNYGTPCTGDAGCPAGQVCSLMGQCIEDPASSSCVASVWTGAGRYEGSYQNRQSLQADPRATEAALNFNTSGGTEILYQALTCVASGGCGTGCTTAAGRIGCPAYRSEAVRILVAFTDEDSDGSGTAASAGAALRAAGITLIGVWSGSTSDSARNALVNVVRESGSFDRAGNPLVFNGMGAGVVPQVTQAINEVVEGVPLRVTISAADEPGDDGDALQFIDHLETNTSATGCTSAPTEDTNGDSFPDAFPALTPGTPVCWDVVPRQNDTVMPELRPLVYRARLTVSGDGSPLDSRLVYFLVPPRIPEPGGLE